MNHLFSFSNILKKYVRPLSVISRPYRTYTFILRFLHRWTHIHISDQLQPVGYECLPNHQCITFIITFWKRLKAIDPMNTVAKYKFAYFSCSSCRFCIFRNICCISDLQISIEICTHKIRYFLANCSATIIVVDMTQSGNLSIVLLKIPFVYFVSNFQL